MKSKIFYIALILGLCLSMNYKKFGEWGHEIFGVCVCVFALYHAFARRKILLQFRPRNLLNFALLLSFLATFASAIFVSEHVFSFVDLGFGSDEAKNIHMFSTHFLFLCIGAHIGLNFKFWQNLFKAKFRTLLKFCLFIAVCAFGIYSFVDLHFYEYLFFKVGFGLENKNSFLFSICEYFSIFCAVVWCVKEINLKAKF